MLLAAWAAEAQEPVTSRLKLSIGGYIKPEMVYKTASGTPGLAGSVPGVQNFGFTAVPQHNTLGHDNGEFAAVANETRFNFTLTAPDWRGLKPTAFLEMDFEGDTASTVERLGAVAPATGIGNPAGSINNGGFRIRHAFFRLAGEGMGGSWNLTFGQTWATFGLLPYYAGSSLSFGGATIFGTRNPQLSLQHTVKFLRDFAWQSTAALTGDTTNLNEMPGGEVSGRLIYSGWQGWMGGARTPTNLGISARVQRQKADYSAQPGLIVCPLTGIIPGPGPAIPCIPGSTVSFENSAAAGTKTLSATAWGLTGGIFLPILPGVSATDRTWALSAVSEAGYGEGVQTLIPGTNPLPGAVTMGSPNRADPGASYIHLGKCSLTQGPWATSVAVGNAPCGAGFSPTELSLIISRWTSYNVQFYLPWNFWLSGGQKWIWYTNPQNATDATCVVNSSGGCAGFIAPVNQGRSFRGPGFLGPFLLPPGWPLTNNGSILFTGKDSVIKRQAYSYVALFYDMTPNIRWGFEWGMHGTDRRDSGQDGTSHRWQFGAYYFF